VISDQVGTPLMVVDTSTGKVVEDYEFDEFGVAVDLPKNPLLPFGFAGGLYDPETELVHFGMREYDAKMGRWTSKDPIGFNGGDANLYGYVANDPVNFVDPSGLSAADVIKIRSAFYFVIDQMINNNMRRPGMGSLNGLLNNSESLIAGISMIASSGQFQIGNLYEGCGGQSSLTRDYLRTLQTDDSWSFEVIFSRSVLSPVGHFQVRGVSSNKSDPVITLDPWAGSFSP